MRVLVCGGRDYWDALSLGRRLDTLNLKGKVNVVIHGGANGADALAKQWADQNGVRSLCYPANWKRDGKAAGPIRNAWMLADSTPDLVLAFSGGRGTADMVAKAHAAGVKVIEVK